MMLSLINSPYRNNLLLLLKTKRNAVFSKEGIVYCSQSTRLTVPLCEAECVEAAQHLHLLGREVRLRCRRVQEALARIRRHGAHLAQGAAHHVLALGIHAAELLEQFMGLTLLFGRHALDRLHPVQNPLALLRRHGVEALQSPAELDLPVGRKRTVVWVLLQPPLLLLGRKPHLVTQPVAVARPFPPDHRRPLRGAWSCIRRAAGRSTAGILLRLRNSWQRAGVGPSTILRTPGFRPALWSRIGPALRARAAFAVCLRRTLRVATVLVSTNGLATRAGVSRTGISRARISRAGTFAIFRPWPRLARFAVLRPAAMAPAIRWPAVLSASRTSPILPGALGLPPVAPVALRPAVQLCAALIRAPAALPISRLPYFGVQGNCQQNRGHNYLGQPKPRPSGRTKSLLGTPGLPGSPKQRRNVGLTRQCRSTWVLIHNVFYICIPIDVVKGGEVLQQIRIPVQVLQVGDRRSRV